MHMRQTINATARWAVALALAAGLGGCSKSETAPAAPKPKQVTKRAASPGPSLPEMPPEHIPAPPPRVSASTRESKPKEAVPRELPSGQSELERFYVESTDFESRIKVIYKLSLMSDSASVETLNRLFLAETDVDLKVEIVDSLTNTPGQSAKKLEVLKAAVQPDQVADVRQSAIEGLVALRDLQALTVLQALLSDKDREIRDAASAAIIEVQDLANAPISQPPR